MSTAENHRLRSTTCSANLGFRKVSIETCRSQHPFFGHGDLQDHLFCLHQIWDQDFRGPCQAIVRHQEVNIHHIKGIFRPPTQWASQIFTNMQISNSRSSDRFNTQVPKKSMYTIQVQVPNSMDITNIYNNASQNWDPKSNAFGPRSSAIPYRFLGFQLFGSSLCGLAKTIVHLRCQNHVQCEAHKIAFSW